MTIRIPDNYLWWKLHDGEGRWIQSCDNPGFISTYDDYLRARKIRWAWINNDYWRGEGKLISDGNKHKLSDLYFDEVVEGF